MLGAIEAVEAGATAAERTDAVCVSGRGVAARTSYRAGSAPREQASRSLPGLPRLIAGYQASLAALDRAKGAATTRQRAALSRVVRDGQGEASAVAQFASTAAAVWPRFTTLAQQEQLWITRATTPWYRTDREAADAYAVLVLPTRPVLTAAQRRLEAAVTDLRIPTQAQAQTLAAADAALAAAPATTSP